MQFKYKTRGVCSNEMRFEIEDNKIISMQVIGGCHGNLQGISSLVKGMNIEDAISRLKGIRCGFKSTSCPDQLAQALESIKQNS